MRLDDVCIVNSDVTASDDFYREGVGLERRMRNVRFADFLPGSGPRLAMWLRPSIAETVGPSYPTAQGLPFRVTLALPDAAAVEAAARRIPGAARLPGTGAVVTDPDGFVTVLTAPAASTGPGITSVELAVSDVGRTADFLERMGFVRRGVASDARVEFDGGDVTLTVLAASTVTPEAVGEPDTFTRSGGHVMLAVELDSGERVDELHAELKARGLVDSGPPAVYEWGARSSYFVDPDGYIWEIYAWVETPR
ncbi:VOC family protein [Herbiconiux sp. A18JL235]|uniref:VOC family protein n=1 Tax=Herbiconiux sp. A18JL235 TaxID=3152363 RepID=A0AB39BKK2_9MICO